MTYNLRWEDRALNDLTRVWTNGDSDLRASITAAAAAVDRLLLKDPIEVGESRAGDERVLFVEPLGVTYRVEPDGQTVSVLHVWNFRPRG